MDHLNNIFNLNNALEPTMAMANNIRVEPSKLPTGPFVFAAGGLSLLSGHCATRGMALSLSNDTTGTAVTYTACQARVKGWGRCSIINCETFEDAYLDATSFLVTQANRARFKYDRSTKTFLDLKPKDDVLMTQHVSGTLSTDGTCVMPLNDETDGTCVMPLEQNDETIKKIKIINGVLSYTSENAEHWFTFPIAENGRKTHLIPGEDPVILCTNREGDSIKFTLYTPNYNADAENAEYLKTPGGTYNFALPEFVEVNDETEPEAKRDMESLAQGLEEMSICKVCVSDPKNVSDPIESRKRRSSPISHEDGKAVCQGLGSPQAPNKDQTTDEVKTPCSSTQLSRKRRSDLTDRDDMKHTDGAKASRQSIGSTSVFDKPQRIGF